MKFLAGIKLALLSMAALSGCAVMNKDECTKADWQAIGMTDGSQGRAIKYFAVRSEACAKHGIRPDQAAYDQGRARGLQTFCTANQGKNDALAGLKPAEACDPAVMREYTAEFNNSLRDFCTPLKGYGHGRIGAADNGTCPPELAGGFRTGYRLGRELNQLTKRMEEIKSERVQLNEVLANAKSTRDARDAANRRLGQLDAESILGQKRMADIEDEAVHLPVSAPTAAR